MDLEIGHGSGGRISDEFGHGAGGGSRMPVMPPLVCLEHHRDHVSVTYRQKLKPTRCSRALGQGRTRTGTCPRVRTPIAATSRRRSRRMCRPREPFASFTNLICCCSCHHDWNRTPTFTPAPAPAPSQSSCPRAGPIHPAWHPLPIAPPPQTHQMASSRAAHRSL